MKQSHPLYIAIPGDKPENTQLKHLLMDVGLIDPIEANNEILSLGSMATLVSLNPSDALKLLTERKISGVINSESGLTETLLSQGKRIKRNSTGEVLSYDTYDRIGPDGGFAEAEFVKNPAKTLTRLSLPVSQSMPRRLRVLTRTQDGDRTLEQISRRGDILTEYPYFVRMLLAQRFGGGKVGRIQKVQGNSSTQLMLGFGASSIDEYEGNMMLGSELQMGEVLFESRPIVIVREGDREENSKLRKVMDIITNTLHEYQDKLHS